MVKKAISLVLTFILSFSLCTIAFAVDNENYNVFYLPIISDKMPENKQVSKVELYVDKKTDTAFVDLEVICDLIGATCNYKKSWYDVRRDYTYFKYNSSEDMKLYLSNSSNGVLLLDGKLFESRMINNRWHVDYIKFCDMFGVNLIKVDKTTAKIDDLPNYNFNEFENEMNFDENPYYIFMYTGTTLSSLYEKLMKYRSSYFWNVSSWARDDLNFLQKPFYSKYGIASSLVEGSIYSNVVNEWGSWTSKFLKQYNSEEQYSEALLNVCNINYLNYSTVDSDSYSKADDLYAFVKNVNKVNKSNKYIKKIIENSDLKDDFPEYLDEIKYFGIFTNVMNTTKASVQAFNDTQNFYNKLNNINQEKVDLLKYSIIDNNKLNSQENYQNVVNNVLTAVGGNFGSRVILNSINNPVGLLDSANKLYNIYNDKNAQFIEALNKSLEDGTFYVSDIALKKALNSNAKTKMISIGMSVVDKFMSWTKSSYGSALKDVQNVYQYYYIEQSILNELNEKNPEILYNRLVMALQASLCIYISSGEMVGKTYDQEVIDIANMLETLETGKNNHILNINYYRDPRNKNISDDIKKCVLNYQTESEKNKLISDETNNTNKQIYSAEDKAAFIQALLDNESEWNKEEYDGLKLLDTYFFDVDFDGKPELLTKFGDHNYRTYKTYVYYYEDGLKKYKSPINDGMYNFEVYLDTKNQKHILRGKNVSGTMVGAGGTHYFDIEINRESSKSTLYACDSWIRDPSSREVTHTYYKYNNVTYTTLEEAYNSKIEITEDEYNKIMAEKSEGLEPVFVDYESLHSGDYGKYNAAQKKSALEKAYDSFCIVQRSDQIQYYNGKRYYTIEQNLNMRYPKFDFSQARPDYVALPSLSGSIDGSEFKSSKFSFDNFIIADDKIYFTKEYPFDGPCDTANLYVCDINGKNIALICEHVFSRFVYSNGNIYFQHENAGVYDSGTGSYGFERTNKDTYNIATGKITGHSHNFDLEFQGKIMEWWPNSVSDTRRYYDGAFYYVKSYPQEQDVNAGNMRLHLKTSDNKDYVVGRWWNQAI